LSSLVVFELGSSSYGLAAGGVQEMVRAVAVARLPAAPEIVEGVINVRGTIVPVLDVRRRFGLPARPLAPDQTFIVARAGARLVALRVDRVSEVLAVAESEVTSPETLSAGTAHLAGVARHPGGLVVITDLARFLALDEERRLDAAFADAEETS
jgi:purine-binding chemotaxis protein CheW